MTETSEAMLNDNEKMKKEIENMRKELIEYQRRMESIEERISEKIKEEIEENAKVIKDTFVSIQSEVIRMIMSDMGEKIQSEVTKEVRENMEFIMETFGESQKVVIKEIKKDIVPRETIINDVKETVHRQLRINEVYYINLTKDIIMAEVKEMIMQQRERDPRTITEEEINHRREEQVKKSYTAEEIGEEYTRKKGTNLYRTERESEKLREKYYQIQKKWNDTSRENMTEIENDDAEREHEMNCENLTERKTPLPNFLGNKIYENTLRKTAKNEYEHQQRNGNIMIFGAEESKEKDPTMREEEDTRYCDRIFKNGIGINVKIRKVIRLGKREEYKKRPMLVKMESRKSRSEILENVKNLAKTIDFKGISITADLSPEERMERRREYLEARAFDKMVPERNFGQFLNQPYLGVIPKKK